MEMQKLIDLFEIRRNEKEPVMMDFFKNQRPYLLIQSPPGNIWGRCNTIEEIYQNNIQYFEECLKNPYTDILPYLEPWIGVGIYANAFGCKYLWREDNAPDTHYCYHKLEDVKNIEKPDWRKSPLMKMVLDCIHYFNDKTGGRLPIVLTDTQSPYDTATLVLDTTEFFTACYTDQEAVMDYMQKITDLVIEFTHEQMKAIGTEALVQPGHIFPATSWLKGIALSDDNIAVASPDINEMVAMPFNQQIADAFGGLAVHSCGTWNHTMPVYKNIKGLYMIDCALGPDCDPNPNPAADVRDSLRGSGVIAKVRVGANMTDVERILRELIVPDLRTIVQIEYVDGKAGENYKKVKALLDELYAN